MCVCVCVFALCMCACVLDPQAIATSVQALPWRVRLRGVGGRVSSAQACMCGYAAHVLAHICRLSACTLSLRAKGLRSTHNTCVHAACTAGAPAEPPHAPPRQPPRILATTAHDELSAQSLPVCSYASAAWPGLLLIPTGGHCVLDLVPQTHEGLAMYRLRMCVLPHEDVCCTKTCTHSTHTFIHTAHTHTHRAHTHTEHTHTHTHTRAHMQTDLCTHAHARTATHA